MEDDFLEAQFEERYEGEDYNVWEEQQVFLDNEGGSDDAESEIDEDVDWDGGPVDGTEEWS